MHDYLAKTPILVFLYVVFLIIISFPSREAMKHKRAWYNGLDTIADLTRIALFIDFWVPTLLKPISAALPFLFIFTWAWLFCSLPYETRHFLRRTKSDDEKRFFIRWWWLALVFVMPAFYYGFRAAMLTTR